MWTLKLSNVSSKEHKICHFNKWRKHTKPKRLWQFLGQHSATSARSSKVYSICMQKRRKKFMYSAALDGKKSFSRQPEGKMRQRHLRGNVFQGQRQSFFFLSAAERIFCGRMRNLRNVGAAFCLMSPRLSHTSSLSVREHCEFPFEDFCADFPKSLLSPVPWKQISLAFAFVGCSARSRPPSQTPLSWAATFACLHNISGP